MLEKVILNNCKTLKKIELNIHKVNCVVGKNGVGKSTIMKSLNYFYESLDDKRNIKSQDFDIFDHNNPYNKYVSIELIYDFSYFNMIIENYKNKRMVDQIKESEFMKKLIDLSEYVSSKNKLSLTLKISKDNKHSWIPTINYDLRSVLKTIFPFYFISLNKKKENEWKELWEMIEDLAAFSNINNEVPLEKYFKQENNLNKFTSITEIIKKELSDSDIMIKNYKNKENFLRIIQLLLGGEELKFKYKDMNFFSEGTNSFNYLNIYCKLLNKISQQKIKMPILFIDEPEVGLHPKYIDYLFLNILNKSNKYQVFLTTHSSRVLKNIVKNTKDHNIIHAYKTNSYTKVSSVNNFLEEKERLIFSDEEGTYYLSDKIIFVEGRTEVELFNNNNIKELFPLFSNVEVYSYDADSQQLATIHPKVRNTKIPYLIIVDSDYIFNVQNGKLVLKKGSKDYLNPLDSKKFVEEHRKELFYFGERSKMLKIRNEIIFKSNNNTYKSHKYWSTIYGEHFINHVNQIKEYCLYHNLYPVATTIEGALVNVNNVDEFKDWLIIKYPNKKKNIEFLYNELTNQEVKATVFRLCINGKLDNQSKFKKTDTKIEIPSKIRTMENIIVEIRGSNKKTNGWVSEWINYVFENHILKETTLESRQKKFFYFFPELFDMISTISNK